MNEWEPSEDGLVRDAEHILTGVFRDAANEAIERFSLPLSFDFVEPNALVYGHDRGAELIGKKWAHGELVDNPNAEWAIDEFTREKANALIEEAVREGWSFQDLAGRLEESGLFGDARAELVARTEIALAMNGGKAQTFRAAGIELVYVYDGDYDPECQEADGQTWTIDEAEDNPLEHPNCERDFRPLTESELAAENETDEEAAA